MKKRTVSSTPTCPVAKLAIEVEAILTARVKANLDEEENKFLIRRLERRMKNIVFTASYLQARSTHGALFHTLVAGGHLDAVNNCTTDEGDAEVEDMVSRCLYSVEHFLEGLGASLPEATEYFASAHADPQAEIAPMIRDGETTVRARNRTLSAA